MNEIKSEAGISPVLSTDGLCVTPYDQTHPYVRKLIGCGHGRLFSEPCVDCEIVGLMDEYKRAVSTVQRVRNRLRQLRRPMPGATA